MMTRAWLLLLVLIGCCSLASTGAAEPAKKKRIAVAIPELSLTSVYALGASQTFPGGEVSVRGTVVNRGTTTASVAMYLTPTHPTAAAIRSSTISVAPGKSSAITMKIRMDPLAIKQEQFKGLFMLATGTATSQPYILQQYPDANRADNVRSLTIPVIVHNYDVTATVELNVRNGCSTGSKWWGGTLRSGNLAPEFAFTPYNSNSLPEVQAKSPRNPPIPNPFIAGPTALFRKLVVSGGTYPVTRFTVRVSKQRNLTLVLPLVVDAGIHHTLGTFIQIVPPATWSRNQSFTSSILNSSGAAPYSCGGPPNTNVKGPDPAAKMTTRFYAIPVVQTLI